MKLPVEAHDHGHGMLSDGVGRVGGLSAMRRGRSGCEAYHSHHGDVVAGGGLEVHVVETGTP